MARDEICAIVDAMQGAGAGTRLRRMMRAQDYAAAFALVLQGCALTRTTTPTRTRTRTLTPTRARARTRARTRSRTSNRALAPTLSRCAAALHHSAQPSASALVREVLWGVVAALRAMVRGGGARLTKLAADAAHVLEALEAEQAQRLSPSLA